MSTKRKKIQTIATLMIISEILLLLFVSQWISTQYKAEKSILRKDLFRKFSDAHQEVIDSMLVNKYINPMLSERDGVKIQISVDENNAGHFRSAEQNDSVQIITSKNRNEFERRKVWKRNNAGTTINIVGDTTEDILLKGVKLIYNEVQGPATDSTRKMRRFFFKVDTTLFKKAFEEKMAEGRYQFKLIWGVKRDSISEERNRDELDNSVNLYFHNRFEADEPGVLVTEYQFFLVKKIGPELAFAFILLVLSSIAFALSYRSMKQEFELNVLKNDVINNLSHELKTPVATVKIAIEALQNFSPEKRNELLNDYLGMASSEMIRLEEMITKVLSTSALENGKQILHKAICDISFLVSDVVDSMELQIKAKQAKVIVHSTDQPIEAFIDTMHIRGMLLNLLDNSLKYVPSNPEILIELKDLGNQVEFIFSDNGEGIPKEYLRRVFEKFFRVPQGKKHNVKGYGLGLTYVYEVVNLHKGKISVKNKELGGVEFHILIPKAV